MATLTKVTCRRCNGSGRFSFHLMRGTICFKCEGSGIEMIDAAKEAKKKIAAEKRAEVQQAKCASMIAAWNETIAEMNALLGPFDVTTALGVDQLNKACGQRFGKSISVLRDERLLKL